jgi:hypothetical protein
MYCDLALYLAGPTGVGKSEMAALQQQHYGPGMDARHLPASWSSTGNALEGLAFLAKDALLVVDDFAPHGSTYEVQAKHREAERILRAQGNLSGRQRMRPDGTLAVTRYPRGMILSTGEDIPIGQSLRARLVIVEVGAGDIDWTRMTSAQTDAASGVYAQSMAGFIRWLAGRYEEIQRGIGEEFRALRTNLAKGDHKRTGANAAQLALGLKYFLVFAGEIGALGFEEQTVLWDRGIAGLMTAAEAQERHLQSQNPVDRFLELISAALASGEAHVTAEASQPPDDPGPWGWRQRPAGSDAHLEWFPEGHHVGWLLGDDLYLIAEAAFRTAQRMARDSGASIPATSTTLWKRMDERRLLESKTQGRCVTEKKIDGMRQRSLIHLNRAILEGEK